MKPKISVLIPVLNEERYIGKLLEALTKQTFKDFEVIVSGGKSKDKTEEVVRSYNGKLNLRYIGFKKNGVAFQRNQAAKNAQSGHFIFLDADTYVKPNFLDLVYKKVVSEKPGFLTSWNLPLSKRVIDHLMLFVHNVVLELTKWFAPMATGTFMYVSREAFEKSGGFDEKIIWGEDSELCGRIHGLGFKYVLLKKPPIYISVRRFDKQGRLNYIFMLIRVTWYIITRGPLKDPECLTYKFGHY